MAWTTPKVDFNSNDGLGFADINKINENLTEIWNVGIKEDTNASWTVGRGKMGYISGVNDVFYLSHYDKFNASDYTLRISNAGQVNLNTASGQTMRLQVGASSKVTLTDSLLTSVNPFTISATTGEIFKSGANLDISMAMGRSRQGFISGQADTYYISHYDQFNTSDYTLRIASSGQANLNAPAGQILRLLNGGSSKLTIDSSAIELLEVANFSKAINPTTTPTSGQWTVADNGISIPRGQYNVSLLGLGGGLVRVLQNGKNIMQNTSAGSSSDSSGGGFFSDGTNTTLSVTGTSTADWYKF